MIIKRIQKTSCKINKQVFLIGSSSLHEFTFSADCVNKSRKHETFCKNILIEIIIYFQPKTHLQKLLKLPIHLKSLPSWRFSYIFTSPTRCAITHVEMAVNNRQRDQHNKRQVDWIANNILKNQRLKWKIYILIPVEKKG